MSKKLDLARTPNNKTTTGFRISDELLNRFQRILIRWEKKAENYIAFLHLPVLSLPCG
jgi:hypothetical protein